MMNNISSASKNQYHKHIQPTLQLDSLRTYHTQVLVNEVSSTLYSTPINTHTLTQSLTELRRHLESPLNSALSHPASETNAIEVLEHILFCWVCARASQADAQIINGTKHQATADAQFAKYAAIPEVAISEAIRCTSHLATMGVGIAAVAQTSIPASLALSISFAESPALQTSAFRVLSKLCTRHSAKRPSVDGNRWESDTGTYAVLDAFTRTQAALRLRSRFDTLANATYAFSMEAAHSRAANCARNMRNESSRAPQSRYIPIDACGEAEKLVTSALVLVNTLVEAHLDAESRLRIRRELLDTAFYQCMKRLEDPVFENSQVVVETRRFRMSYANDIRTTDPCPLPPA
ncbi:hypothetical protein GQ54DRAFT_318689 [Martensiomyces pterosporus]|nr:hypothetical protein GQ54DRAFT_318689 [Martensiomyces pterosporus]